MPSNKPCYHFGIFLTTQIAYGNCLNLSQINLGSINSQRITMINTSANMSGRTRQNFVSNSNNNEGFDYDAFISDFPEGVGSRIAVNFAGPKCYTSPAFQTYSINSK